MTGSTEVVYKWAFTTGHEAKLKPKEENGLTHDWSVYVKATNGRRFLNTYVHLINN